MVYHAFYPINRLKGKNDYPMETIKAFDDNISIGDESS